MEINARHSLDIKSFLPDFLRKTQFPPRIYILRTENFSFISAVQTVEFSVHKDLPDDWGNLDVRGKDF
jgi:hypothetical protein